MNDILLIVFYIIWGIPIGLGCLLVIFLYGGIPLVDLYRWIAGKEQNPKWE